jgi:deoxyribodipyrimidine photo-lyase
MPIARSGSDLPAVNLVWFKKDLRVLDHSPLVQALQDGPTIAFFVVEDSWTSSPEFSDMHYQFAFDCLEELKLGLTKIGVPLVVGAGCVLKMLTALSKSYRVKRLYSHEETGLDWTFKRDIKVKAWCRTNSIVWIEQPQFAVIRPLKDRDLWNKSRNKLVHRKPVSLPRSQSFFDLSGESQLSVPSPKVRLDIQRGGTAAGLSALDSFLYSRGQLYPKQLSSPVTAYRGCSRLSPYLSWGALSLPLVHQRLDAAKRHNRHSRQWSRSYKAFESRLWWHCHFIQKLESEPSVEFNNVNPGFDGLREDDFDQNLFEAWKRGETGYPIIDSCMRALHKTGWINFRMRALLVSFASYHLWLHWRKPAQHLARLFVDFEPGIHFNQVQMQSGVTGINTLRIYSPLKQSLEQDPSGEFIRTYCPELSSLPAEAIHQPHLLSPLETQMFGVSIGADYPEPIVDAVQSYTSAKERIFARRECPLVKLHAQKVLKKHGSRKNTFFPNQNRRPFGNLKSPATESL